MPARGDAQRLCRGGAVAGPLLMFGKAGARMDIARRARERGVVQWRGFGRSPQRVEQDGARAQQMGFRLDRGGEFQQAQRRFGATR